MTEFPLEKNLSWYLPVHKDDLFLMESFNDAVNMTCRYPLSLLILFSVDIDPKVRLVDHMVILISFLFRNFYSIFHNGLHSHQNHTRICFTLHPMLALAIFVFSIFTTFTGGSWYLIMVWLALWLVALNINLMYQVTISVFSLGRHSFKSFTHF